MWPVCRKLENNVDAVTTAAAPRYLPRAPLVFGSVLLAHAIWLAPLPLAWRGTAAELLLALPGALLGALIAWFAFSGNAVDVQGLVFKLTVTSALVINGVIWAVDGLLASDTAIGGSIEKKSPPGLPF